MNIKTDKMCANEIRKVGLLLAEASKIGRDVSGYGMIDVNKSSGNVYLWLEDYPDCMYIGLNDDAVCYGLNCPECGHEWDSEDEEGNPVPFEGKTLKCPECGKRC